MHAEIFIAHRLPETTFEGSPLLPTDNQLNSDLVCLKVYKQGPAEGDWRTSAEEEYRVS